jgi:hypothetical protein
MTISFHGLNDLTSQHSKKVRSIRKLLIKGSLLCALWSVQKSLYYLYVTNCIAFGPDQAWFYFRWNLGGGVRMRRASRDRPRTIR